MSNFEERALIEQNKIINSTFHTADLTWNDKLIIVTAILW